MERQFQPVQCSEALSNMKVCENFYIKDIEKIYEIYTNFFPSVTISTLSQNLMQLHRLFAEIRVTVILRATAVFYLSTE